MSRRSQQDFSPFRSVNHEVGTAQKKPSVIDYAGYEDK